MSLGSGSRLGTYEILAPLGAGGMGEVYRAKDLRLGREVALKVLPAEASADADRLARFEREARTVAGLNHPNIVTLHSVEDDGGVRFLTMELVEGTSLNRVIAPGGLPIRRVIEMGIAMADALAAAHEKGVVHRDLRPANVMLTKDGRVKVLDFGLAKLVGFERDSDDSNAPTLDAAAATRLGTVMGTPAYMSPEQAEGQHVDTRSDVFSFGTVLYEMLTGRRPFEGASELSLLSSILRDTPPSVRSLRPDADPRLESLVERCLEKDPAARPATARELVPELEALLARDSAPSVGRLLRRPAWAAGLVLVMVVLGGLGFWAWRAGTQERWARRVAMPEIQRLIDADEIVAAFRLARKARGTLADDLEFQKLWHAVTVTPAMIDIEPEGAEVFVKPYEEPDGKWERLGVSPIKDAFLPFTPHRIRITKPGFAPVEAVIIPQVPTKLTLVAEKDARPGMVYIPAGRSEFAGTAPVDLPAFWLDRYELTNREYKAFVDAGGYRRPEFWKRPFLRGGRPISFDAAMALFRDRTGRPGPSTWELGSFPEGQADSPVSGVSWYEAAAYAEFAGKSLPTVNHWFRAAHLGIFSDLLRYSNFNGEGPGRVGARPSLSGFGTYDMAGNVREWAWNASGDRRYTLGGAWSDPTYLYTGPDALDPFDRDPILGVRCAVYEAAPPDTVFGPLARVYRDWSKERPVLDDVFAVYKSYFDYDHDDLAAKLEGTDERPEYWRIERVSFAAAYGGERIIAQLFIPRNAAPPYQTVVYFPPSSANNLRSSEGLGTREFGFLVRSGRAVLFPVYQGTYERRRSRADGPNSERDLVIQRTKDVRRAVDYLESRPDIDHSRLAFYGLSMGAKYGPVVGAVESRFRTIVLVSGGMAEDGPPEVSALNFAPRVRVPVLMENGRYDFNFPLDESQRPLFRLFGTREADKKHVLFESGHVPPFRDVVRVTLDWLDRYSGSVNTGAAVAP